MRTLLRNGVVLLVGVMLPGLVPASEPVYGVCRKQIIDYVEKRLGQTVTRVYMRNYAQHEPLVDLGDAFAYVKECPGYHYFEVYGTKTVCEDIPHYGSHPGSYVGYRGAYAGCEKSD